MLQKRDIRRSFNKSAGHYDEVAVLQRQVADELLQRLDIIKTPFYSILDAGCGTGYAIGPLMQHYPKARLIALDLADEMLRHARSRQRSVISKLNPWARSPLFLCSDLEQLALENDSVDFIYSSLSLQWCNDVERVFKEWKRVLKPGGMLLFSTLGPDTLKELRQCWQAVDGGEHVHGFMDMHNIGDALLSAGFAEPVMDVDNYTLTYSSVIDLMRDLKTLGAVNASHNKTKTLTGKRRIKQLAEQYENYRQDARLPASYEVVFGHAWKSESKTAEVQVSFSAIDHHRNRQHGD